MNRRDALLLLPAAPFAVALVLSFSGNDTVAPDVYGTSAIRDEYKGFDALAHRIFGEEHCLEPGAQ